MRIGINGLLLSAPPGTRQSGTHQYLRHLIDCLPEALGSDVDLMIYGSRNRAPGLDGRNRIIAISNTPTRYERLLTEHLVLPIATRRDRIDLVHHPAFAIPRCMTMLGVVTFHDLAFLRWPEHVPRERYAYLSRAASRSVRKADRMIAVSEATRLDMIELLGANPDRIDVTPLGVDPEMKPASELEIRDLRTQFGLERPFVLSLGNLEPRKNLESLLEAFKMVADQIPHDLVLAGPVAWKSSRILEMTKDPHIAERVKLPGFIPAPILAPLYSAADLFVIPSWYEGFGLTLLEAMACGTPALSSNRGSLPEVGGNAAVLIDPFPEHLAQGMLTILNDETLKQTMQLSGLDRAREFNWRRTAELTVASYRRALAQ